MGVNPDDKGFSDNRMRAEVNACLRRATLAELREVASWITSARECELWAGPRLSFPLDVSVLPARIDFDEARTFAMSSDDRLVAFGQIVPKALRRAHLARVIVAPAVRGCGHGERLIRSLIDEACRQSHQRISLNVDRSNVPAIALYSKLGFLEAERPADEPDAHGSRYMELRARP